MFTPSIEFAHLDEGGRWVDLDVTSLNFFSNFTLTVVGESYIIQRPTTAGKFVLGPLVLNKVS